MTKQAKVIPISDVLLPGEILTISYDGNADQLLVVPQKDDVIHHHGVLCRILRRKDDKVLVEATHRVKVLDSDIGSFEILIDNPASSQISAAFRAKVSDFVRHLKQPALSSIMNLNDSLSAYIIAGIFYLIQGAISLSFEEKLSVLDADIDVRLQLVIKFMDRSLELFGVTRKLAQGLLNQTSKEMRRKQLQKELDALGASETETADPVLKISRKLNSDYLSEEALKIAQFEMNRLKRMNPQMAEYQVILNYLDWIVSLPWKIRTNDVIDIKQARATLDADHFGMEKPKNRIIEYLAVLKLNKNLEGPILCFVGPPGVGKTSIARSIARATQRKLQRISLGGVRDESEIRGHRRTYLGSMPGTLIQGLKRVNVTNPVILLDEIDKMSTDSIRGNPAAALLEVLDPEQNHAFVDHYLGIPFDLSNVLFVATANSTDSIPKPLLDRMEIITLSGYTALEKYEIARRFLIPKQIKVNGLTEESIEFTREAIEYIIQGYTREPGIRSLERQIAAILRFQAINFLENKQKIKVDKHQVNEVLGIPKYSDQSLENRLVPGVSIGMVWTSNGTGDILFIESSYSKGKGSLELTGQLGQILQESSKIALSWVKANASRLFDDDIISQLDTFNVHIHFPSGSVPKDGPSAGCAIVACLVSLFSNKPLRQLIAVSGEISLQGHVLPVGGIKEKVLAAHRYNIKTVILPRLNQKDIENVPLEVRKTMNFRFVDDLWDVLALVFEQPTNPLNDISAKL